MGYKYLTMETKYTVKNIEKKRDHLSIKWADNFKSKFHFLWLRDNCPTAIHPTANMRVFNILSVNKKTDTEWENIKHIIISHINEYYADGNESIINKANSLNSVDYNEIEKKIIHVLETKVRPAVAKDGGDIKFKEFKDGKVKVELQGSCSGCPSSTLTLKQGVQNLLCHYVPEVKEVLAV